METGRSRSEAGECSQCVSLHLARAASLGLALLTPCLAPTAALGFFSSLVSYYLCMCDGDREMESRDEVEIHVGEAIASSRSGAML